MFIILEFQTDKNGTVAVVPPVTKDNYFNAQNSFLQAASLAAISTVPKHTVMLIDENGAEYDKKIFNHNGDLK